MLLPWRKGIVTNIHNETADTRSFSISVPELEIFDFKPGQFVTLDLPIHQQKNKRWRSYSIASPPSNNNNFELLIKKFETGAGSSYLFDEIHKGSELSFRGPQGVFHLPAQLDKNIYFICTGTGVAPFRSMIMHIQQQQIPHHKITLVYGCRTQKDVLYEREFRQLENDMKGFAYLPVFSREKAPHIRSGYVHAVYEELIKADPSPAYFFLCGWKNMIDEARQKLSDLGIDKKNIHFELYG
jgi:ferredoxin-NADP reductase